MAFKLKHTAEGVSLKLALFILPPTDVGVERFDYVKYAPNNKISPKQILILRSPRWIDICGFG